MKREGERGERKGERGEEERKGGMEGRSGDIKGKAPLSSSSYCIVSLINVHFLLLSLFFLLFLRVYICLGISEVLNKIYVVTGYIRGRGI